MAPTEPDWDRLLDEWRAGRAQTADLYRALRGPMYRAARQGVRSITAQRPDTQDVEDAVFTAFKELEQKDPATVTSIVGLARRIAYRRGQDRGRAAVRRREQIAQAMEDPTIVEAMAVTEQEVAAEAERERLYVRAAACLDELTPDQADVVRATVMGDEGLSDWAFRNEKSHQAASRQRDRALKALARCIERQQRDQEGR
jgi:DNA-directed RNA polymerase specialized sigma24 family protein